MCIIQSGPACRPRPHILTNTTTVELVQANDTNFLVIERIEQEIFTNDTVVTNSTLSGEQTTITDIIIPIDSSILHSNTTDTNSQNTVLVNNQSNRVLMSVNANNDSDDDENDGNQRRRNNNNFNTLAGPPSFGSIPSLPSIDTSALPSFDSSMITSSFDRTMNSVPSMMSGVISQISANPPSNMPSPPSFPSNNGPFTSNNNAQTPINLGTNTNILPVTSYNPNTVSAGTTSTTNDPAATAQSLGITYHKYNEPITATANAPKPAATCALTDVHCQMYKSCYPCCM